MRYANKIIMWANLDISVKIGSLVDKTVQIAEYYNQQTWYSIDSNWQVEI